MANREHVAVVKQDAAAVAVAAWRIQNPLAELDLIEAELNAAILPGVDLRNSDSHRTNLKPIRTLCT